jgi:hypothetical protein
MKHAHVEQTSQSPIHGKSTSSMLLAGMITDLKTVCAKVATEHAKKLLIVN